MMDAKSTKPLIADAYAERLLGAEGLAYWEDFKSLTLPNGSNIARCYIIDQHLKSMLMQNPETTVILVGAGLDSRAFRLTSGNWIEFDEPSIIEYKNQVLPSTACRNPLKRISIDFETEKLEDKIAKYSSLTPLIIIIEGVIMYLTAEQKTELFSTLTRTLGKHVLLCDLMTKSFFNRMVNGKPLHNKLSKSGAHFNDMIRYPARLIKSYGYKLLDVQSNVITARKFGLNNLPKLFVTVLFRRFFMGYSVYKFEYSPQE
jgi:methyltransferase (TIGR00027 family)